MLLGYKRGSNFLKQCLNNVFVATDNGHIEFDEFCNLLAQQMKSKVGSERFEEALATGNKNKNVSGIW